MDKAFGQNICMVRLLLRLVLILVCHPQSVQDFLGSLRGHPLAGLMLLDGVSPLHLRGDLYLILILDA